MVIRGGREAFIDRTVAVVVATVAKFGRAGIDGVAGVVAVGVVRHVARGLRAGDLRSAARAVGIAVGVKIVGGAGRANRGIAVVAVGGNADAVVVGVDAKRLQRVCEHIVVAARACTVVEDANTIDRGRAVREGSRTQVGPAQQVVRP